MLTDKQRDRAVELVVRMSMWLGLPAVALDGLAVEPTAGASAELIHWCQEARDLLAAAAREQVAGV